MTHQARRIRADRPADDERIVVGADGLPRRAFTVDDLDRMVAAGIVGHDERIEIVDGELLPMAAKGPLHEVLKRHWNRHLARELPDAVGHIPEGGWRLGPRLYLEPDFTLFPAEREIVGLAAAETLLVVELAHSSLRYDRGRKAKLYAREGVRDLWVVDVRDRSTRLFRDPGPDGYRHVETRPATEPLVPLLVPGYTVRLADLPGL